VRADLKRGRWQAPTIARRRFGEYAHEWRDSRVDFKPTTRQQYAGTLRKHVLPHLGDRPPPIPVEVSDGVARRSRQRLRPAEEPGHCEDYPCDGTGVA
jgi:hypothetical protein